MIRFSTCPSEYSLHPHAVNHLLLCVKRDVWLDAGYRQSDHALGSTLEKCHGPLSA